MAAQLDGVRLVMLQFSFSSSNAIPPSVKHLDWKTGREQKPRPTSSSGALVIEPTERCSVAEFVRALEEQYQLVDVSCRENVNYRYRNPDTCYVVRFTFVHPDFVAISNEFKNIQDNVLVALGKICDEAFWRVRVYSNPFYRNGLGIPGQYALSIDLGARQALFRPDGQPVVMWQKDRSGQHVGVVPIPPRADYCLRIVGDAVELVAA